MAVLWCEIVPHVEVEIHGGEERCGVLKNTIVTIGDCRGVMNGGWRTALKEGVSCTIDCGAIVELCGTVPAYVLSSA